MKITGVVDYRLTEDLLRNVVPRQVPYALASTLTKLAGDARDAIKAEMPIAFDSPTDYTVRGVATVSATKSDLEASVFVPDSGPGWQSMRGFMRAGVYGTFQRSQKKTEFLLSRLGVLPQGWVTTPGRGAKLDSHGNMSGRIYAQIINVLQLKARVIGGRAVAERAQKRAKRLGVDSIFFAVTPGSNSLAKNGGWLPPGVWERRKGNHVVQVLKFVRKAGYEPRLDFMEVASRAIALNLGRRWEESEQAIRMKFAMPRT